MSEKKEMLQRVRERVFPKIPREFLPQVEIEVVRLENEISLRDDVLSCTSCLLAESCTNKVPGIGPAPANIMFVGEGPGEQEDIHGEPFVGRGGQLLNKAIEAVGWSRDDIYITNVVKCRTPNNRQPVATEIAACYQHLKKEIEVVQPKVIVCWGAVAANTLIHPNFKITQEHGEWFQVEDKQIVAVFHPSYLLRLGEDTEKQNQAKWEVFNVLSKVKQYQNNNFKTEE